MNEWADKRAKSAELIMLMYRHSVQANLGGQLFVRAIEVPDAERKLDNSAPPTFLELPFTEAIDYFKARYPRESDNVDLLLHSEIQNADKNTKQLLQVLAQRARRELLSTLKNGGTVDDFIEAMDRGAVSLGIDPLDHSYLETVFKTQVGQAYGAGRFTQLQRPEVQAACPFVKYVTAGDARVRPSHAALHNTVYRTDSDVWHNIAPPNGFNCRCAMMAMPDAGGKRARSSIPDDGQPDDGFNQPPTV